MAIVKTTQTTTFGKLTRGAPFAATTVLYTRTDFKEEPKEYLFYKLNNKKAVTVDKRTTVMFLNEDEVTVCAMEDKAKKAMATA